MTLPLVPHANTELRHVSTPGALFTNFYVLTDLRFYGKLRQVDTSEVLRKNGNTENCVKSTVRIPAALWKRARRATGPQHTLQRLLVEGLELRVAQLEKDSVAKERDDVL